MAASTSTGFPRDAIEACVDRVATSRHFSRSRRLGRFLRFTVESTLDGSADRLRERTIGVEVYGRPQDYDPRTDAIVRSEAHRLRARLDAYYAQEGAIDPIVIAYPKGGYVAEFHPNATEPRHGRGDCRLIVAGFEDRGSKGRGTARARLMEEVLGARLAGWPGLQVLVPDSREQGAQRDRTQRAAEYRVDGGFEQRGGQCSVAVRIVRLADEEEIWSETEQFTWDRAGAEGEAVAGRLAASIGAAVTRSARPLPSAAVRAHALYVKGRHSVIQYGNALDPRDLESARRRLRAAVEEAPEYVEALAELAHLELMRLYPPRGDAAQVLTRARSLLDRALANQPRHARSLYLLGHVEGSAHRPREALRLTESAVASDPDDPEGRTMLAVCYTSLGFWETAVAACDWALALDPVWDSPHRIKAYLLTRMGDLDATRRAIDTMVRSGTSPTEVAMARFDLRLAAEDFAGARKAVSSGEPAFASRPDLEDRREIAHALAEALEGRPQDARRKLVAHRSDGPRFWDHTIRLALVLGEQGRALELLRCNPINRSYRWLATEALARPHLYRPGWRALADELHASWLRDLEEVGPRLTRRSPPLPDPARVLRRGGNRSPGHSVASSSS